MNDVPVEIISTIVENFAGEGVEDKAQDNATIYNCMLVNRTWFYESARILYRNYPDLELLGDYVKDQKRRQMYANFFEKLYLEYDIDALENSINGCEFGKLKELKISCDALFYGVIDQFLAPTLEKISIHVGIVDDSTLLKIADNCPNLKELVIKENPDLFPIDPDSRDVIFAPTPKVFSQFLNSVPYLNKFYADMNDISRSLDPETSLATLGSKKSLTDIVLPALSNFQVEKAIEISGKYDAFSQIKTLYCRVREGGFFRLVRQLTNVESLKLVITADHKGLLESIGNSCPNLTDLYLRYPSRKHVSCRFNELSAISHGCPQLSCFKLTSFDPQGAFNDNIFMSFVSAAHNLQKLELLIPFEPHRITYKSIESLGLNCRKLAYFGYRVLPPGRLNFEHSKIFTNNQILFPNLDRMEPWPRSTDHNSCFTQFATNHMPRLVKNCNLCMHALCEIHKPDGFSTDEERETERAIRQAVISIVGLVSED